jgi:NitT/TauT family transport system ATP-binding protein
MEVKLSVTGLTKSYRDLTVFSNFSATFLGKKVNCILGPSGCGKTSLLNMIGGTLQPDSGDIGTFKSMSVSYVFQEPRLLPWRTVAQNIAFVLENRYPKSDIPARVNENLEKVELLKFRDYYPGQLSGGMKQRVALARAFASDTELILMDEPFRALDVKLKNSLMEKVWETDPCTVIFVSHDVDEVLRIGHHILLFSEPPVKILTSYTLPGPLSREKIKSEIHGLSEL